MREIAFKSAVELAGMIRDKRISSTELLELYIERYNRFNPEINAIIATDFDSARENARKADQALAKGEYQGPLHGLPATIKDSMEAAGLPCTWGSPSMKDYIPARNAATVQSLVDAGAVIFGKTNIPLFAMDFQSFNDVYGQTNNPWDVTRTPGGSSGGAAAALAAGLTGLDIGSDIGGSIRAPSNYCGIYGHKSTYGIIPIFGQSPVPMAFPGEYTWDIDLAVSGPLGRSAEDLDLVIGLMVQPPVYQRKAMKIKLPPPRRKTLKSFKIGLWLDDAAYPVDSSVGTCLQNAADRLAAAGASMTDRRPDISFKDSDQIYRDLLDLATALSIPPKDFKGMEWAAANGSPDDLSPGMIYCRRITSTHRRWQELHCQRILLRQKWADYFRDVDVLLCPVAPVPAFKHDHGDIARRILSVNNKDVTCLNALLPWIGLATVSYLPATVAPAGLTREGLPVGIQIIGPYLEDRTPIHLARLMETVVGGFRPPPGY